MVGSMLCGAVCFGGVRSCSRLVAFFSFSGLAFLRTYHNAKGEGRLMSIDLVDESVCLLSSWYRRGWGVVLCLLLTMFGPLLIQGEIRATAFGDTADRIDQMIEQNKVRHSRTLAMMTDYLLPFGGSNRIVCQTKRLCKLASRVSQLPSPLLCTRSIRSPRARSSQPT